MEKLQQVHKRTETDNERQTVTQWLKRCAKKGYWFGGIVV